MQVVLSDSHNIRAATLASQQKIVSLGEKIVSLEKRYLPLLQASQELIQTSYVVNHEITRYVTQDSEDGNYSRTPLPTLIVRSDM